MEALVLAGGLGTRLRQAVPDLPKAMAPVAGRPFLEILLQGLARKGFTRVILSLGYKAEAVTGHFGESFAGMRLVNVVEEVPLGTGGAVRLAMDEGVEDHLFVLNGDTYLDLEAEEIERHWQGSRAPVMVGREVPDTARYGRLLAEGGRVVGFSEKGVAGARLINAGCYVLNRGQLDGFARGEAFSLEKDYLEKAVREQRFDLFVSRGMFIDIGVPEDYARAQALLAKC